MLLSIFEEGDKELSEEQARSACCSQRWSIPSSKMRSVLYEFGRQWTVPISPEECAHHLSAPVSAELPDQQSIRMIAETAIGVERTMPRESVAMASVQRSINPSNCPMTVSGRDSILTRRSFPKMTVRPWCWMQAWRTRPKRQTSGIRRLRKFQ